MKKALFLDRDGVINVEKEYLHKIDQFEFIDGIFDLCRYYSSLEFLIIVVTNQSGIARNYYSEEDFEKLTQWMIDKFLEESIVLTDVFHCPHHEKISGECSCRKPKPGMLIGAAKKYDIDLENSIMIGDKERDIEAGLNAGVHETYLFDESKRVAVSKATKIVSTLESIWKDKC